MWLIIVELSQLAKFNNNQPHFTRGPNFLQGRPGPRPPRPLAGYAPAAYCVWYITVVFNLIKIQKRISNELNKNENIRQRSSSNERFRDMRSQDRGQRSKRMRGAWRLAFRRRLLISGRPSSPSQRKRRFRALCPTSPCGRNGELANSIITINMKTMINLTFSHNNVRVYGK